MTIEYLEVETLGGESYKVPVRIKTDAELDPTPFRLHTEGEHAKQRPLEVPRTDGSK